MIAQLMAARQLSLFPDCEGAAAFRQALKLCSSPKTTLQQLAGMQAALAGSTATPEIRDLCQQALHIRRSTLQQEEARRVSFKLSARGRLVGGVMLTTQRQVRAAFWQAHPHLSKKRITNYAGTGTMYPTDTRVTFIDWLDAMQKNGEVPQALAERTTLRV